MKDHFHSVLGRAAQWTAGMRAIESLETTDALFADDMAPELAGKGTCKRALELAEVRYLAMVTSFFHTHEYILCFVECSNREW